MLLWYLAWRQERLIFRPHVRGLLPLHAPEEYGLEGVQETDIHTEDGEVLLAWALPPPTPDAPFFVMFHGNTGHWGHVGPPAPGEEFDPAYRVRLLEEVQAQGGGFVAVGMRGYGNSSGKPSEAGFLLDVAAVLDYVEGYGLETEQLIFLGESLGAAIAGMAAEQANARGMASIMLVKIAPFASVQEKVQDLHGSMLQHHVEAKLRHRFDNVGRLKRLAKESWVMLLTPAQDTTTDPRHSDVLAAASQEVGLQIFHEVLEDAGHITWNAKEVIQRTLAVWHIRQKSD